MAAAGTRAGVRVLQQLRSPSLFFSRAQLLPRSSSPPTSASSLTPSSRGFSADHGPARVNIWEAPTDPARWKEEHFVFVSLAGWFSLFYGGYKAATGQSKPKPAAKAALPQTAVATADPSAKKTPKKQNSIHQDSIVKGVDKPAANKKEEKPVSKKEEHAPTNRKDEKVAPKKEKTPLIKRETEKPAPKREAEAPMKKAKKPNPSQREDNLAEHTSPSANEKKSGYKLVKVDNER